MSLFRDIMKISAITILFGILSIVFGWLSVIIFDPILRLQLGEIAIVLLILFFYSLSSDQNGIGWIIKKIQ